MTHNETATLAPAAGAGIGKMLADALLGRPDFLPQMEAAAMRGLNAVQRRWDKESDDWIVDADCRVQATWFFGLLAHMEGEPIKRIVHQHLGAGGQADPLAALQESPALRDAARRMLEKAEWREGGAARVKARQEAKAATPVIEMEPGPVGGF